MERICSPGPSLKLICGVTANLVKALGRTNIHQVSQKLSTKNDKKGDCVSNQIAIFFQGVIFWGTSLPTTEPSDHRINRHGVSHSPVLGTLSLPLMLTTHPEVGETGSERVHRSEV